ncbi:hypothetical protein D3C85_1834890 [compost metagenome]
MAVVELVALGKVEQEEQAAMLEAVLHSVPKLAVMPVAVTDNAALKGASAG